MSLTMSLVVSSCEPVADYVFALEVRLVAKIRHSGPTAV
jgi:hypothetical protein